MVELSGYATPRTPSLTPPLPETMPAIRSQAPNTQIEKYDHTQRRTEPVRSRASFADRLVPRTQKKLTPAEKATRKDNRDQHRTDLNDALGKAVQLIWEQAEAIKNEFPQHNTEHYFKLIIQNAHTVTSTRKVSIWNAFVFGNKDTPQGISIMLWPLR